MTSLVSDTRIDKPGFLNMFAHTIIKVTFYLFSDRRAVDLRCPTDRRSVRALLRAKMSGVFLPARGHPASEAGARTGAWRARAARCPTSRARHGRTATLRGLSYLRAVPPPARPSSVIRRPYLAPAAVPVDPPRRSPTDPLSARALLVPRSRASSPSLVCAIQFSPPSRRTRPPRPRPPPPTSISIGARSRSSSRLALLASTPPRCRRPS